MELTKACWVTDNCCSNAPKSSILCSLNHWGGGAVKVVNSSQFGKKFTLANSLEMNICHHMIENWLNVHQKWWKENLNNFPSNEFSRNQVQTLIRCGFYCVDAIPGAECLFSFTPKTQMGHTFWTNFTEDVMLLSCRSLTKYAKDAIKTKEDPTED